ncbi:peptidoglycan-binding protein [Streptomyces antarcticus]|uniref:peptidoglycan-binding protein n=1 Tax=Streptomyces antarcticus TaxID=2996458 RepID=UPI0022717766|nr:MULTISPECIES: peptidoglycan-binding protein [unclassified Streptomyces]MCY0942610.1 peptidoglycan-binding protein [Streptomyces sp. H34-AA3]MCZ4081356.1 peptidoglycan-binding protein [Streptomyces sp. H34-S5]
MAPPFTPDRLAAILRAEGVNVIEFGQWRTHDRAGHGAWGPINGVIIHHTVTTGTASSVQLCHDGYAGLPGPLCHGVIAKNGDVYLISAGRANHAGAGDSDVLAAVVDERTTPAPNEQDTDGNARFYGFEAINLGDGADPWPDAQLDAIERVSAAICRAYGWSAASVIGHKEWTATKTDPRGFSMTTMRERVGRRLATGPGKPVPQPRFEPYPGDGFFRAYPRSPIVTAMGARLVAEGCSAYVSGPGPQFTGADLKAYAKWQRKQGHTGAAADGWPGRKTWDALRVPKV